MGGLAGRYLSPLRYPGGKGKLANFVKLLFLENDLVGTEYVEPYAGGASVALSLLLEDYAEHVHINDINIGVHAFWQAVLHQTDDLCERIEKRPVSIREWHRQRDVATDPTSQGIDLAFATFFLNRTNRSGIISGGVIGGLDQAGPWKIDARYNKPELIRRIRKISRFRSRITVTNLDALAFLDGWTKSAGSPRALLYLDPPYYVKGEGLYDNFYGPEDHKHIAEKVATLAHPWVVTYDATAAILRLYESYPAHRYQLSYSAHQGRHVGSEVMFASSDIALPSEEPSGIASSTVQQARAALAL